MIKISKKSDCCGCGACMQKCPKQCIAMVKDEQGFLYPETDIGLCIQCGLCESVCPVINEGVEHEPLSIYAAKNKNEEERYLSSSGGIFVLLANTILEKGGVVFGVRFDKNWHAVHSCVETKEHLRLFMGSKYVQSRTENTFKQTKDYLNKGCPVLYTGTPCQIAGLKNYLGKEYERLLTIEVLCHGVPSPRVWDDYLNTIRRPKGAISGENTVLSSLNDASSIEDISFRDKQNGWRKFGFVVRYSTDQREGGKFGLPSVNAKKEMREYRQDNLYMKSFLKNLCLRPSCFHCPSKGGKSRADISLGDFWKIKKYCKDFDDDKGVTLVYLNSDKGVAAFHEIDCESIVLNNNVNYNRMFSESCNEKYSIDKFWEKYEKQGIECVSGIVSSTQKPLYLRVIKRIKKILNKYTLLL